MNPKVALSAFKYASAFVSLFFFLFRSSLLLFILFSSLFLAADSHTNTHNPDDLDEVNNKKKEYKKTHDQANHTHIHTFDDFIDIIK